MVHSHWPSSTTTPSSCTSVVSVNISTQICTSHSDLCVELGLCLGQCELTLGFIYTVYTRAKAKRHRLRCVHIDRLDFHSASDSEVGVHRNVQ